MVKNNPLGLRSDEISSSKWKKDDSRIRTWFPGVKINIQTKRIREKLAEIPGVHGHPRGA